MNSFNVPAGIFDLSSATRKLDGMKRTAAPDMPNAFDTGSIPKVGVNAQVANNQRLRTQNFEQNFISQLPQENADGRQQFTKQMLVKNNEEYSQNFARQRVAEVASVLGSEALEQMGTMVPPEQMKLRSDIAVGKASAMGINPDLVQNQMLG